MPKGALDIPPHPEWDNEGNLIPYDPGESPEVVLSLLDNDGEELSGDDFNWRQEALNRAGHLLYLIGKARYIKFVNMELKDVTSDKDAYQIFQKSVNIILRQRQGSTPEVVWKERALDKIQELAKRVPADQLKAFLVKEIAPLTTFKAAYEAVCLKSKEFEDLNQIADIQPPSFPKQSDD